MARTARKVECGHPDRPHFAHGVCRPCYAHEPRTIERRREYWSRPEVVARKREYRNNPDQTAKRKAYMTSPDVRARKNSASYKAVRREYLQRPDVAEREKARSRSRRAPGRLPLLSDIGNRDGWRCIWAVTGGCFAKSPVIDRTLRGDDPLGASYEHLIPVSRGGTNEPSNLSVSHLMCNKRHKAAGTVQLVLAA